MPSPATMKRDVPLTLICLHLGMDGPGTELEVHVEAPGDGETVEDGHHPVQYSTVQCSTVQYRLWRMVTTLVLVSTPGSSLVARGSS